MQTRQGGDSQQEAAAAKLPWPQGVITKRLGNERRIATGPAKEVRNGSEGWTRVRRLHQPAAPTQRNGGSWKGRRGEGKKSLTRGVRIGIGPTSRMSGYGYGQIGREDESRGPPLEPDGNLSAWGKPWAYCRMRHPCTPRARHLAGIYP